MISVEKISNKIAKRIAGNIQLSKEKEEVIAYGAFNLLHTLLATVMLILFGVLFEVLIEIMVISITAALLRRFSGGAHASSPGRCSAITLISFGLLSLVIKYIQPVPVFIIVYQLITLPFIIYSLYKKCPLDSPNKPIKDKEQKNKLRIRTFVFTTFLAIVMIILWFLFIKYGNMKILIFIIAIHTGILWQSFLLTYPGQSIITGLDCYLKKLFKGGE